MTATIRIPGKRHKYGAKAVTVDNIRFQSKREAARYGELKLLLKAGKIESLELQPRFPLKCLTGKTICEYRADFKYYDVDSGEVVFEDTKGFRTRLYAIKKRWVEEDWGITIKEV